MRGRTIVCTLCAALAASLLTAEAEAQTSRRVKITRGPAIVAPGQVSASDTAVTDDAPVEVAAEPSEAKRPNQLRRVERSMPVELQASMSAAAPAELTRYSATPQRDKSAENDPQSLTNYGSKNSYFAKANWSNEPPTPDDISSDTPTFGEPSTIGEDSLHGESSGCGCSACGGDACDAGCTGCDSCSVTCGRPFGIYAGAEATFLRPNYSNTNPNLNFGSDFGYEAAPRLWIGYQGKSGWGIRGRYWDLDADAQRFAAFTETDTSGAFALSENLDVYDVDLELTRTFWFDRIEWCASVGARTGRLHHGQVLNATIFDTAGGGGDDASLVRQQIDRNLNGTGFTLAIGARRPIADTRLALYCNLRGSVIWGTNAMNVQQTVIEALPVGAGDLDLNDFSIVNYYGSNGDGMWIGEIQAGGEWDTPINNAFGAGNAFIRVLFEGQWWQLPGVTVPGSISTVAQYYDFLGITAAIGFSR